MTRDLFDLAGQVVVVSGGLGQLGRQFALALAQRGARVAALDLPQADRGPASRLWGGLAGDCIRVWDADVTNRASLEAALGAVTGAFGTPTGLVNNAALDAPPDAPAEENGPFETYPETSLERILAVNTRGVFLCCQVIGGALAAAGRGAIVNVSSIYGLVSPDQRLYVHRREAGETFFKPAAYAVSKSALLNLTRYLATYWAPRNVRVNTVTFAGVFNHQDERFLELYQARVPLGRMAREDEYNGAIVFLLSEAAAYMTGANLVIDGGWTAW
jgi:NAD(P)-dependent dehydrogenase (short-subunit alcohol dehydrogenase family)